MVIFHHEDAAEDKGEEVERNAKRNLRICTSSTRRQKKVKLVDKMGSTTGSSGS